MYNGKGILKYDKFSYYNGNFVNSLREGEGILYLHNFKMNYQGNFKNDKRSGQGKQTINGVVIHDGQWANDKISFNI